MMRNISDELNVLIRMIVGRKKLDLTCENKVFLLRAFRCVIHLHHLRFIRVIVLCGQSISLSPFIFKTKLDLLK